MTKMDVEEDENILDYSLDNISIRTDILQRMVCNSYVMSRQWSTNNL